MLTSREKSPLQKNSPHRSIKPSTLHWAGQPAQHTTKELFQPPDTLYNMSPWNVKSTLTGTGHFSLLLCNQDIGDQEGCNNECISRAPVQVIHAQLLCDQEGCNNECISRAPAQVIHAQLCTTSANTKISNMHIGHPK